MSSGCTLRPLRGGLMFDLVVTPFVNVLVADTFAVRARSAESSFTTSGMYKSSFRRSCWRRWMRVWSAPYSRGISPAFSISAAAVPTAWPRVRIVDSTRVEPRAMCVTLMLRPAIMRLGTFTE